MALWSWLACAGWPLKVAREGAAGGGSRGRQVLAEVQATWQSPLQRQQRALLGPGHIPPSPLSAVGQGSHPQHFQGRGPKDPGFRILFLKVGPRSRRYFSDGMSSWLLSSRSRVPFYAAGFTVLSQPCLYSLLCPHVQPGAPPPPLSLLLSAPRL